MSMAVMEVGAALFGACIGSFLNVVIHRLPQDKPAERSLGGRSHCPHCGAGIRWFDNVPLFGWLWLRGRARCCGNRISARYPGVELLTAALFWLLAANAFAGTEALEAAQFGAAEWAQLLLQAAFIALLIACTFIDFDHFLLPDALTKPGMALGLIGGLWPGLVAPISDNPNVVPALNTFLGGLIGLLVGGGVTWGIRIVGTRAFGKEAMGFGDVKFMAMIGAFLGWEQALLTMFLACVFGAVIGGAFALCSGATRIPFGPYLALGALVCLFASEPILRFLFETWPQWQRDSTYAPWFLSGFALLSLVALVVFVRRGRRRG